MNAFIAKFLTIAACLGPTCGFGALSWNTQKIDLTATHGATQAMGVFYFKNSGNTPITITDISTSCGCTSAELTKRIYGPGESGEIKAIFVLGERTGQQENIISVTTDEIPTSSVLLVLRVMIPDLVNFSPRMLLWRDGEAKAAKSVTISPATGYKFARVEIVRIDPSKTTARIESLEEKAKYTLTVLPDSATWAGTTATIFCLATFSDGTSQRFLLYALVR